MPIKGQTNVLSSRFGRGAAAGLGEELEKFVVATMDVPWMIAAPVIGGRPAAVLEADSMEFDVVDAQVASAPQCDTVLAVGGGRAIDLGKYLAWKRGCRLVTVPTVLSVDAFVTPAAGLRRDHRVEYVGEASPDPLVVDYDLLRTAPDELNIAGAGDLLSIHTATFDWELADRARRSEYPLSADDVRAARAIVEDVRTAAGEIRACSDDGLRMLVEGYMRVNTICLPRGHYRVEEGSEHFLFYELEERLGRPFIHGHIIGLGVCVMSRLQNNAAEEIVALMNSLGLTYQPRAMQLRRADLVDSLKALPEYVTRREHWYSVINDQPLDDERIEYALRGLEFI